MKRKHDKRPAPIVRKTSRGLEPVNAGEAERVFADPIDTEYDLVKRSRRSNPQNSLYWQTLQKVVDATGRWPTAERLHECLKLELGYFTPVMMLDGSVRLFPGSTAFDQMDADEFREYFDRAVKALAEHTGIDPLAFYDKRAEAA